MCWLVGFADKFLVVNLAGSAWLPGWWISLKDSCLFAGCLGLYALQLQVCYFAAVIVCVVCRGGG